MPGIEGHTFTEDFTVTPEILKEFQDNGFILLKGVLNEEEISLILKAIQSDNFMDHLHGDTESNGKKTDKIMWKHPGNDITGMVARSEKVAGIGEQLMEGELYHYHTKLMMKNAQKGARHNWHQDYGYWYWNGCLFPDFLTVFLPLDKCTKENSCLQILSGSHKCGRLDHQPIGEQYGCDPERAKDIMKVCDHHFVEMDAGDALFFHCNLLHSSSDNNSDKRRWAFITCYNKRSNNPTIEHHHPRYTPLHKVPNSSIKNCTNLTDMTGKCFFDPDVDTTIKNWKSTSR